MKLTRKHAEQIAKDFLTTMNPTSWDGNGTSPKEFDKRIKTYDFGSPFVVLDISFEYDDNEGWYHLCEIVDKGTAEMYEMLSGYGIDSYLNLTDTILDICNTYDWFI
jgi:hypothetical protein